MRRTPEEVQKLNEELGEDDATLLQMQEDRERVEAMESFFRTQVIGKKSNWRDE